MIMKEQTQKTMFDIINYLTETYGTINPAWGSLLDMYADNLDMLSECKEALNEAGIFNFEKGTKNPLLSTIKDLKAQNIKILDAIGVGPWVQHRMKSAAVDDTDNFLETLVSDAD